MNEYMKGAVKEGKFDHDTEIVILRVIDLLKPLGKEIFRRYNNFSTGLYDAITVGVASHIEYYAKEGLEEISKRIQDLKNDVAFGQLTGSSNSKSRILNRMKIAERIFRPNQI